MKPNTGAVYRAEFRPKTGEQALGLLENWRVCDGRIWKRAMGVPQKGADGGIMRLHRGETWRADISENLGRVLAGNPREAERIPLPFVRWFPERLDGPALDTD
jgi:hypothetical protein